MQTLLDDVLKVETINLYAAYPQVNRRQLELWWFGFVCLENVHIFL